jgi:hypothetical protein
LLQFSSSLHPNKVHYSGTVQPAATSKSQNKSCNMALKRIRTNWANSGNLATSEEMWLLDNTKIWQVAETTEIL